jgi:UDP-N-acetylglucosamine 2-epimerase (non-hydrolysing)
MRQCIFVIGTRAQLVKISPVLRLATSTRLDHVVWFTGQHHESIDDLIMDFELTSNIVQPPSAKERSSIGKLIVWIPATLYRCVHYIRGVKKQTQQRPLVIVHGDTLSTWIGALAGGWGGGDVVHLESGLSSGKWSDPFPEELLRRLTFRRARYALCPNDEASKRMQAYADCTVVNTHENTLLDCVRFAMQSGDRVESELADFVVSVHRFQNIYQKDRLQKIVDEIEALATLGSVFFILHPPTELRLKKYGLFDKLVNMPNVRLLPRMPYTDFLALMGAAKLVLSDGGSNQEELAYLGVPTVLFRDRSERPDGLGGNIVFRRDVSTSLAEAVKNGEIEKLRRNSKINDDIEPSRLTVDALQLWSADS